jgi:hypothetical protein
MRTLVKGFPASIHTEPQSSCLGCHCRHIVAEVYAFEADTILTGIYLATWQT